MPYRTIFVFFLTLRKKYPNTEFLLVCIFPYFQVNAEIYTVISVFSLKMEKYGPGKISYLDTFYTVELLMHAVSGRYSK